MGDVGLFPGGDLTEIACLKNRCAVSDHMLDHMARHIETVNQIAEGVSGIVEGDPLRNVYEEGEFVIAMIIKKPVEQTCVFIKKIT